MTKYLLIICVFGLSVTAWSQTDPLYAQYQNNPLLINPAYAGFNKAFSANISYRKQWAGFEGNPETINVNAHSSFNDNKVGFGISVVNDRIGSSSNTEVNGVYSYRVALANSFLSFGLQAGLMSFKTDYSDLNVYDPNDPAFLSNLNTTRFNFGAGAIFHNDKIFIGVSLPRMMKAKEKLGNAEATLYQQHFYVNAAYAFYLNERVRLKPSFLIKGSQATKISTDVNIVVNFEEKYAAGIFTRNLNTYGFLAQLKVSDKYRMAYAFEIPSNKSVGASFTTHEVSIGVNLSIFNFHDNLGISVF